MAIARYEAFEKLRRNLSADAPTSDAGIIKRADLVDAIYTELVHRLQTDGAPPDGILTASNADTLMPIISGAGNTYNVNPGRLQNLQTPESFEVNNFIKASRDVGVDNIIDTLLAIVYKMTALRRATWIIITDPNAAEAGTHQSDPYLTMLDLDAQLWYNELDDLARRYNIDSGTDVVGTNGTSTGEAAERAHTENTGIVQKNEAGIPLDFSNVAKRPYCLETPAGYLGLAAQSTTANMVDSLNDPVYAGYSSDLKLIQLNRAADPKRIFFIALEANKEEVVGSRGDFVRALDTGNTFIYDGAFWLATTSLKNLDGLGSYVDGTVKGALAINAYTTYDATLGVPPTLTTHQANPGLYQLLFDLRALLFRHRDGSPVLDISACHANCHGNCHGSRNRR